MVKKTINNQTQWDTYIQTLSPDVEGFRIISKTHEVIIISPNEVLSPIIVNNIKIKNNGTIFIRGLIQFANNGTITNKGTINNLKLIANNKDAKLNNDGTINNNGTIRNDGDIYNVKIITNANKLNNKGTINNLKLIVNSKDAELINDGTITNKGSIDNDDGGVIENKMYSTIENWSFIVGDKGIINNYSLIDNKMGKITNKINNKKYGIYRNTYKEIYELQAITAKLFDIYEPTSRKINNIEGQMNTVIEYIKESTRMEKLLALMNFDKTEKKEEPEAVEEKNDEQKDDEQENEEPEAVENKDIIESKNDGPAAFSSIPVFSNSNTFLTNKQLHDKIVNPEYMPPQRLEKLIETPSKYRASIQDIPGIDIPDIKWIDMKNREKQINLATKYINAMLHNLNDGDKEWIKIVSFNTKPEDYMDKWDPFPDMPWMHLASDTKQKTQGQNMFTFFNRFPQQDFIFAIEQKITDKMDNLGSSFQDDINTSPHLEIVSIGNTFTNRPDGTTFIMHEKNRMDTGPWFRKHAGNNLYINSVYLTLWRTSMNLLKENFDERIFNKLINDDDVLFIVLNKSNATSRLNEPKYKGKYELFPYDTRLLKHFKIYINLVIGNWGIVEIADRKHLTGIGYRFARRETICVPEMEVWSFDESTKQKYEKPTGLSICESGKLQNWWQKNKFDKYKPSQKKILLLNKILFNSIMFQLPRLQRINFTKYFQNPMLSYCVSFLDRIFYFHNKKNPTKIIKDREKKENLIETFSTIDPESKIWVKKKIPMRDSFGTVENPIRKKETFNNFWTTYNNTRLTIDDVSKFTPSLKLNSSGKSKRKIYSSIINEIGFIKEIIERQERTNKVIFESDEIINYGFEWKTQWLPENRDSKNLLMVDSEPDNIEEIDDIINTYFKDETYFLKFYKDT